MPRGLYHQNSSAAPTVRSRPISLEDNTIFAGHTRFAMFRSAQTVDDQVAESCSPRCSCLSEQHTI